jgi:hypothetical protein
MARPEKPVTAPTAAWAPGWPGIIPALVSPAATTPPDFHGRGASAPTFPLILSLFRAPSTHEIDDKAYHQNQAKPPSADHGPAKVKTAAAEQKQKNNDQEQ